MLIIKYQRCKRKIFRYVKRGTGKLWRCWKDRIVEDFSIHDGKNITCMCGNQIGLDEEQWIKLKQHSFFTSGTKT
jgi:hypothetical protein